MDVSKNIKEGIGFKKNLTHFSMLIKINITYKGEIVDDPGVDEV
jgi:hypothetical protein